MKFRERFGNVERSAYFRIDDGSLWESSCFQQLVKTLVIPEQKQSIVNSPNN